MANSAQQFAAAIAGTLKTVQQRHVAIAKGAHAAVMAQAPAPDRFNRYVDGVAGAAEERVKPDGLIVYDYPRIDLVTDFAMAALRELSPVDSGDYRDAHQRFLNDLPVENFRGYKSGDRAVIANFIEYARRIEVGAMKMRVPGTDHVYAQAHSRIKGDPQRADLMRVQFTFVNYNGATGQLYRPNRRHPETRFPALIFSER